MIPSSEIASQRQFGAAAAECAPQGLTFTCARTLDEVVEAWRLVYTHYRRRKLIGSNPLQLHTWRPAVGPQSTVFAGRIGPLTVTTLTAVIDGASGLPADRAFAAELDSLRAPERQILELTLFADRRDDLARCSDAILQLIRLAWHWARHSGATDIVMTAHMRHARFYERAFGFSETGAERPCPGMSNHSAVLLRLNAADAASRKPLPRGIEYFGEQPVSAQDFQGRYQFPPVELSGSPIASFLRA